MPNLTNLKFSGNFVHQYLEIELLFHIKSPVYLLTLIIHIFTSEKKVNLYCVFGYFTYIFNYDLGFNYFKAFGIIFMITIFHTIYNSN